ncbi:MAG TPA: glycosyltransferase [Rhizomicrobium sp.]|nr:glycosyltransferase [Rhizomicrobium sp.]
MILNCMLAMQYGGTEKVFVDQLRMLPMAGMAVVGVSRPGGEATIRAHEAGLPCEELKFLTEWDPITTVRARTIVERHNPALILCHGLRAHKVFADAVGRTRPIVAMTHKPGFHKHLPCELFITVAEHRRQFLIQRGVAPQKVVAIPNGVPIPVEHKTAYAGSKPVRIAAIGRLHEKKGFDILIEAVRMLTAKGHDLRVTIQGEGPLRDALEAQVVNANLKERIALPGWSDNLKGLLLESDVFAFPSFQEDFPLVVLEAMSYALPIAASAIDGPKDFLRDGDTALMVPPHDAAAFAAALERLIGDQALRERLGTAARADVSKNYSFEAISHRLADTLNGVIANWKKK